MKTWKNIGAIAAVLAIVALGFWSFGLAEEGKNIEQMITDGLLREGGSGGAPEA